jgi:aspartyl protease family protein
MFPGLDDGLLVPLILILVGLSIVSGLRIPVVRTAAQLGSLGVVGVLLVLATGHRERFEPYIGRLLAPLEQQGQQVAGEEVRLKLQRDGHFWATVKLDGVEKRMLVDSGATITALSLETAKAAGLALDKPAVPVMIRTANGTVVARSAEVEELRLGTIKARGLDVVVSPAFGKVDVLGMNFLSKLKSWRVEDNTLILTPNNPQPVSEA